MERVSQILTQIMALISFSVPFICAPTLAQTTLRVTVAPATPGLEARVALGDETLAILQGATHVQVFRLWDGSRAMMMRQLAAFQGSAAPISEGDFGGYQTIDHAGPDQGQMFVAQMDRLLFDNELYDPDGLVKCFDPGVGVRFWRGKERVDVALCFECGQLSVTTFDAVGKRIHEIPQLAMGFDQPLLVRLIQPVFPRDADIRAVKAYDLPAEVATPEARAAQEDSIRESAFRHLMTEPAVLRCRSQTYYLSISPARLWPADPSSILLQRFDGCTPPVRAVSRRAPATPPQARNGLLLRVAHLRWIEPKTVYLEAGYAGPGGDRQTFTYGLKKVQQRWVVFEDQQAETP